jgi:hypothetical protein
MYLPLKPELLAAALLLIADGVPTFDVEPFCRRVVAMARPVGDVVVCLQKEGRRAINWCSNGHSFPSATGPIVES